MEQQGVDRLLAAALALHLAAGFLHGVPHGLAPVDLHTWQWVFVAVVTNILPILGFVLVWRYQRTRFGAALFAVSMAAALAFGLIYHFVLENPDHVDSVVGVWGQPFLVTAVLVAATDLLGVLAGAWVVYAEN